MAGVTVKLQPDPEDPESGNAVLVFPPAVLRTMKFKPDQLVELVVKDRHIAGHFVERYIAIRPVRQ
jgi:antitoxin component of MazEF toxin-antitoxin module